jgi:ubiquitin C-terminal hydrolase
MDEGASAARLSPGGQSLRDDSIDDMNDAGPRILWNKDQLPPPRDHELEFLVKDPKSYLQGRSLVSHIKALQGSFRFRLLIFPMGTDSTGRPEQLAGFVEVVPPDTCSDVRWAFEQVRYLIAVINWKDYRRSIWQQDTFTFQRESSDRGWHRGFLKASDMTTESGWLNDNGELCLRATCQARRAMLHMPSNTIAGATSRRSVGYVGLKNHGATCYMNCLLQTLFHIGRFRHIVYSIECPESAEQGATSGDDAMDGNSGTDERPALPLLVALQNLFFRLQTSEMVVSCRELMRSFGWDTADAFMQHDAQELNRLLCDRVEEQMKGTPMDGEIKRLFEGEMENYIECVDVDYRSTRMETFYDLQLNVRNDAGVDLSSLEESLRNFTCEEIMEDENAYDAGNFGKQRARKGIRFKRFPPVLHFQLKRFMFDAERLDMCKLNGRLEFPQVLDMEAFAPGSGQYLLHTVVVHSGGVSSGHYYAFVRVRDGEGARWLKFDDEQVTPCSEHAAVDDNYGGEDLDLWPYFSLSPQELREQSPPTVPRIHNAYMLSYVRADCAEDILKAPNLDDTTKDSPYHRMVERCMREAQLAEERRRARVEQLTRIEVRLLLERDLTNLQGFWSHHEMPCTKRLRMSRDQVGEDLYEEVAELLNIPRPHIALFLLQLRKSKQTRFKWISPDQVLRSHLPAHGAPHSFSCEPHFVVLCMAARVYDPISLLCNTEKVEAAGQVEELSKWGDELRMLIIKYFCPTNQRIVCLGCYYTHCDEKIEAMLNDEHWFQERLRPFIFDRQVAPLPSNVGLTCWEEYCKMKPEDILEREPHKSFSHEGLQNGDILIWHYF